MKVAVRMKDGSTRQYVLERPLPHDQVRALVAKEEPGARVVLVEVK